VKYGETFGAVRGFHLDRRVGQMYICASVPATSGYRRTSMVISNRLSNWRFSSLAGNQIGGAEEKIRRGGSAPFLVLVFRVVL
jgi:hypothetical protein